MTIKTVKSSGGDYTTIQDAIDACPANITAGGTNETWEIEVYASVGIQDPISISGKTTDATHYIRIYAPVGQRHLGKPDSSSVRIATSNYFWAVNCGVNNVIFEGLQFVNGNNPQGGIEITPTASVGIEIRECMFSFADSNPIKGMSIENVTGGEIKIRNCAADFGTETSLMVHNGSGSGYTTYIYNCTGRCEAASGYFAVFRQSAGSMVCKNCVAVMTVGDTNTCFDGTITGNNNISSDATAPGTSAQTNVTPSFVDAANGDFHLLGSDTIAKGNGADLHADGSYAFNIDIDGESRPDGAWDAGADQLAGGGQAPRAAHLQRLMGS